MTKEKTEYQKDLDAFLEQQKENSILVTHTDLYEVEPK